MILYELDIINVKIAIVNCFNSISVKHCGCYLGSQLQIPELFLQLLLLYYLCGNQFIFNSKGNTLDTGEMA